MARAAVVDAARTLFLERGYGATTIEAISDRSDVPPATVYRLFSSKRGILKAILDVSIVGDDEAVPLADRPHVRALLRRSGPDEAAGGFRRGHLRGELADGADLPHPRRRGELGSRRRGAARELNRQRQAGQGQIARSLARAGALRPASASATPPTSSTPSCPPRSTGSSSSTEDGRRERYERWLTETLIDAVLPRPGERAGVTSQSTERNSRRLPSGSRK